jgi:hypothetical protein
VFGRNGFKNEMTESATQEPNVAGGNIKLHPENDRRAYHGMKIVSQDCLAVGAKCESADFSSWSEPMANSCQTRISNGYPIPDPRCTPGAINPSVSAEMLQMKGWSTSCVRNCWTSEVEKHITYRWYGVHMPSIDSQDSQVCELDHLIPLELGGSDALANIWPQCGPDSVTLNRRYFKTKDRVERYLTAEVRSGRTRLEVAQREIAEDWTQFVPETNHIPIN